MCGFFIKKNFCDGWDNMFQILIPNLVILAVGSVLILLLGTLVSVHQFVSLLLIPVALMIFFIPVFAFGDNAVKITDFGAASFSDYFRQFKGSIKDAVFFGFIVGVLIIALVTGIPYYFGVQKGSFQMLNFIMGMILIWFEIICFLALQWFIPVRSIMHNDFKKCLKKCFIIFFDNTGFSIFIFIYNLILFALSCVLFFILPGWGGIVVSLVNALRLRLYKYDFLEEHPEMSGRKERKRIPWDDLLEDDRESVGHRSLKSFIFPWKE